MPLSTKARKRFEGVMAQRGEATEIINAIEGTSGPIDLYVNSNTGLDTNTGTSASPFATIQRAIDILPSRLRHLVRIYVAPGNYLGFSANGFITDPAPGVNSVGLMIIGTHVTATLAQGTPTGTITSSVTGSQATPTYTTISDSVQNWAVDALKGLQVMIGTTPATIISNTATQMTLASTSAFANGTAYTIQDWGTVITSTAGVPGSLISSTQSSAVLNYGIVVRNNYFGITNSCVIESIRVNVASGSGAATTRNNIGAITFFRCKLGASTSGLDTSACQTSLNTSVVVAGATWFGVIVSGGGNNSLVCNGTLITSSGLGVQCGVGMQLQGSQMTIALINSQVERANIGLKIGGITAASVQLTGATVDTTNTSQCILASPIGHSNFGWLSIQGTGVELRNGSAALHIGGDVRVWIDSLKGSGHSSAAIIMDRGARVQIGAASTITSATEILMDSVPLLIATMRAASPRLLKNDYGTIIFE